MRTIVADDRGIWNSDSMLEDEVVKVIRTAGSVKGMCVYERNTSQYYYKRSDGFITRLSSAQYKDLLTARLSGIVKHKWANTENILEELY